MNSEVKALVARMEIPNTLTIGKLYPVVRYVHPTVFVISDCGIEVMLGMSRFEEGWKEWEGPLPDSRPIPTKRAKKPKKEKAPESILDEVNIEEEKTPISEARGAEFEKPVAAVSEKVASKFVEDSPIQALYKEIMYTNEVDLPPLFRQVLLAHIEENYFPKEKKFACEVYRLGLTNAISGKGKEVLDVENLLSVRYGI